MGERIGALIEQLSSQHAMGANHYAMLLTLQSLQQELRLQQSDSTNFKKLGIAVLMPFQVRENFDSSDAAALMPKDLPTEKLVFELDPELTVAEDAPMTVHSVEPIPQVAIATPPITMAALHEVPTFSRQSESPSTQPQKELNETVASERPSINDLLEVAPKPELAATLTSEPIKDLRKAISINDRYQFINHLFNGDETMYERSIKTINSFNIIAEATYWIRRELAIKLGWKDDDPLVIQFNQLVNRRFL